MLFTNSINSSPDTRECRIVNEHCSSRHYLTGDRRFDKESRTMQDTAVLLGWTRSLCLA
jgi:hypothetical protein